MINFYHFSFFYFTFFYFIIFYFTIFYFNFILFIIFILHYKVNINERYDRKTYIINEKKKRKKVLIIYKSIKIIFIKVPTRAWFFNSNKYYFICIWLPVTNYLYTNKKLMLTIIYIFKIILFLKKILLLKEKKIF